MQSNYFDLPIKETADWLLSGYQHERLTDLLCYENEIDVLYSFFPPFNTRAKCKKVLTIYDVIPLVMSEFFPLSMYRKFDTELRKSALEADKIIAISQATKNDIIKCYGVDEKKIEVIYLGIQPSILMQDNHVDLKERFGMKGEYILSVCTIEPRKNLKGLVEAFINYKTKHPASDCSWF